MVFHDAAVLKRLRALADKYDLLLIFDEIFTGFGRTGTMFACEAAGRHARHHHAVEGAHRRHAAARGDRRDAQGVRRILVRRSEEGLMHGPTFMANALACAAANAALDLFEREPRLEQVAKISSALSQGLGPCHGRPGRQR